MKINIIIIYIIITIIKSESVCTEKDLIKEIKSDIQINKGKLSCIIGQKGIHNNKEKTIWTNSCSFKANIKDWEKSLKENYKLKNGIIDINGNTINSYKETENQADMCIIIRTLLYNNYFTGYSNRLDMISESIVDYINCPGNKGQSEICAANANSFKDRDSWYIFLDGGAISYNNQPLYQVSNN